MTDLYCYYSSNPRLTWETVKAHSVGAWDWTNVARHSWFTKDMLDKIPRSGIVGFARNPNLTMDIVLSVRDIYTCTSDVSINPGITWEDIVYNPEQSRVAVGLEMPFDE